MRRQKHSGQRKERLALVFLTLTLGVLLLCGPALAEDKTWSVGTGYWDLAGNWTPSGQPANGDNVYLTQSDGTNRVVRYRNSLYPSAVLNSLTIDATGIGKMTLNQGYGGYADPLASLNEYVGYNGKATHAQSLGTNTITNGLYLGANFAAGNGTYTLSGGSLSASNQYLGYFAGATGTISQSGGSNTANNLYLGYGANSTGTYTFSGASSSLSASNVYLGYGTNATATFTQSGGTVTVQNSLTIGNGPGTSGTYNLQGGLLQWPTINLNTGGTFNQTGGTFFSPSFNQNGGTVTGTLTPEGTYNYNSGAFNGRLENSGNANFNADFTAANGVANQGTINVPYVNNTVWRNLTFNGPGLDNSGAFNMTSGGLNGSGPLVNNAWMNLNNVIIGGAAGFTNNGIFQVTNTASFETGSTVHNVNNGEIRLVFNSAAMPNQPMPMADLGLWGGSILDNNGLINLNGNVIHDGTLNNLGAGIINGNGYIMSNFSNQGVINMAGGALSIAKPFTNRGTINGAGTLSGGAITNNGTIEGGSSGLTVGSAIVNHGTVGAGGGRVTMAGTLTNPSDGLIMVRTDSKLIVNQGLAVNDGVISVSGGNFDNNNYTLTNNGDIATRGGLISTGGLINNNGGQIYFSGTGKGDLGNRITGNVTNNSGGKIVVEYDPATFTGNVTNNGTAADFKITSTHYTVLGTFTGSISSDPAEGYFTDVVMRPGDYMQGGKGDRFFISNDFSNQSQQSKLWDTVAADLAFTTGADNKHQIYLPGVDLGGSRHGFESNFAWGTLDITGQQISLVDGNTTTAGGALYAGLLLGAILDGNRVTNIDDNGLNLYYDPLLAGNAYLHGGTYALLDGGSLAPVQTPLPPTVWMVLSGLVGLGMLRRRKVNKS